MEMRSRAARRDPARAGGRGRRLLGALAALAMFAMPFPALSVEDVARDTGIPSDPYPYPPAPGATESVPSGWLRAPAAVFDLLVVRPAMAAGLVAGAGLSLVALPFQAPPSISDDTLETLADQSLSAFTRPLGAF